MLDAPADHPTATELLNDLRAAVQTRGPYRLLIPLRRRRLWDKVTDWLQYSRDALTLLRESGLSLPLKPSS